MEKNISSEVANVVRNLYAQYGCYDICIDEATENVQKAPEGHPPVCTNASVRVYPSKKLVEVILNTENPELLEEFFNLVNILVKKLQEMGYSEKDSRYFHDLYILEMNF